METRHRGVHYPPRRIVARLSAQACAITQDHNPKRCRAAIEAKFDASLVVSLRDSLLACNPPEASPKQDVKETPNPMGFAPIDGNCIALTLSAMASER